MFLVRLLPLNHRIAKRRVLDDGSAEHMESMDGSLKRLFICLVSTKLQTRLEIQALSTTHWRKWSSDSASPKTRNTRSTTG